MNKNDMKQPQKKRQRPRWSSTIMWILVSASLSPPAVALTPSSRRRADVLPTEESVPSSSAMLNIFSDPTSAPTMEPSAAPSRPFRTRPPAVSEKPTLPPSEGKATDNVFVFETARFPFAFDLLLTSTNEDFLQYDDLDALSDEMEPVLENYLFQRFRNRLDSTVLIHEVDVDVTLKEDTLQSTTRQQPPLLRRLQETPSVVDNSRRNVTFGVNGHVDLEGLDMPTILEQVDDELDRALESPELDRVLEEVLMNATVLGANRGDPSEESSDKPTLVAIIFGFLLTALAAASLLIYAYIFWTKRKRMLARKKQFGVQTPTQNRYRFSPKRTVASKPTRDDGDEESESSSSFEGIGSESDDDSPRQKRRQRHGEEPEDDFARELRMAANLDQQAWEDFQRKKRMMEQQGRIVGTPPRSPHRPLPRLQIHPVPLETSGISTVTSFPYGDEEEEHANVEAVYRGTGLTETWHMGNSGSIRTAPPMSPASRYSFMHPPDDSLRASPPGSESGHSSLAVHESSIVSSLGGSNRESLRASPPPLSAENGGSFILTSSTGRGLRGSPIHSPIAEESEDATNTSESFLTSDIVEQVAQLSKFVKKYERKKEKRLRKQQKMLSPTGSLMGYDALTSNSDSLSARKPPVDESDDDDTTSSSTTELSLVSRRLGITPFMVQSPPNAKNNPPPTFGPSQNLPQSPPEKQSKPQVIPVSPVPIEPSSPPPGPVQVNPKPKQVTPQVVSPAPEQKGPRLVPSASKQRSIAPTTAIDNDVAISTNPSDEKSPSNLPAKSSKPSTTEIADKPDAKAAVTAAQKGNSRSTVTTVKNGNSRPSASKAAKEGEGYVPFNLVDENERSFFRSFRDDAKKAAARQQLLGEKRDANNQARSSILREMKPKKTLSSLRGNDAVVDRLDSDLQSAMAPSDEYSFLAGLQPPPGSSPRSRSKNKAFNTLLDKFENKPKNAIFPPNESWQYNY